MREDKVSFFGNNAELMFGTDEKLERLDVNPKCFECRNLLYAMSKCRVKRLRENAERRFLYGAVNAKLVSF